MFTDARASDAEVIIYQKGFIEAYACEVWTEGRPDQKVTLLSVYRARTIKDTHRVFAPVRAKMLEAETLEVLYTEVVEDDEMMWKEGHYMLVRLAPEGFEPKYSAEEVRSRLETAALLGEGVG